MQVRRNDRLDMTFVLRPKDLRKLDEILKEISSPEYEATCADGLTRQFGSIEEVIAFENPPDRKIEQLEAASSHVDTKSFEAESARFSFSNDKYKNVEVRLKGPESKIVPLNRKVDDFFERIRPWYWRFSQVDYLIIIAVTALVASGSLAILLLLFPSESGSNETSSRDGLLVSVMTVGVASLLIATGTALNWLGKKLFPRGTFAIGQGEDRHELREKIRWIVVGLLGTLAVSTVITLIL